MKKFAILILSLALSCVLLVGCGCMNTGSDVPTLPTNGETSTPTRPETTAPRTAATTAPTTMPTTGTTEAPTDTTGTLEGAMDDILGGSKTVLAGGLIQQLINSRDLPMAAALSVLLLSVTGIVIAVYRKVGGSGDMNLF